MRKDVLLFLSFLVDAGYIVSFRVTKDKIFITVLGVLMAFGIAYLIERIREAQGEVEEEYEEHSVPARKSRTEKLSELRYAAAVLRDMKESTKDGAFVQMGAYWYEVQDLTKSIEAIKEAIEEAENEEAG